jgi:predicted nucleic acid-binding protein
MIFLDSSGLYALADRDDDDHEQAVKDMETMENSQEPVLTHCYVVVETAALLQKRLGHAAATTFLQDAADFTVVWVTPELHAEAVREFSARKRSKLSFVDVMSFLVMRREGVTEYFGFDGHFGAEGFTAVSARGAN